MNSDDQIGELLKLAGRRPMPDAAQMSRARAAARAEWMHVVEQRRWAFSRWAFSAAAILAIGLFAAAWFRADHARTPVVPPVEVATLQTVVGTALVTRSGAVPRIVNQPGLQLRAGDRLGTPTGSRAAFSLTGGTSVKLDNNSTVSFDAQGRLTLTQGAVFVDAGPTARDTDFHVSTPLGVVRHLGTQFEVRLDAQALRIRVREGTVSVENSEGRWLSREGEALRVSRGRAPERQSVLTYGSEWGWVNELAPPFVLEASTLGAFLQWASRHHGLRWQYADDELRDRVERIVLHGSIDGLSGDEAFAAVLRTCGLTFRRSGERLIIAKAR